MRRDDVLALALLTAIVSILFVDVLAGVNAFYARDVAQYAYPGKKILRDVVAGGEFPYWNRVVSAGQPLAANPAHEVFYPLTWLILLPDFEYGFQLFLLVHLYIAAWGMYAFLRSLALGPPASFFGALSFALGGMMLSYLTLPPILASLVWMPPALLFTRRMLRHRAGRDFALATLFLAMQLLVGEPTTVLQTGVLAGLYAIHAGWSAGGARAALRNVAIVGAISLAALCLSAVATLPAIDHARDSVRARGFDFTAVTDWSMPPARLGELFHPHLFGHILLDGRRLYWAADLYGTRRLPFVLNIYPGLLAAVLAAAALVTRVRGTRLVLAVFAASLLLALGAYTPLWRLLYDAGVARSVRYPEKFILMGVFALTVLAATMLERLLSGDERARRVAMRVAAAATLLAALGAVVAFTPLYAPLFHALWDPPPSRVVEMLAASRSGWLLAALRGVLVLILLRALVRAPRRLWLALGATFVLLDLAPLVPELAPRTTPSYLSAPPPIVAQLPPEHDRYRLFHHGSWHRTKPAVLPYYRSHRDLDWIQRNAALPLIPAAYGVHGVLEIDYDLTALLATTDFTDAVRAISDRRPDWVELAAAMSNVWYRAVYLDPRLAFARAGGKHRLVQPVGVLRHPRHPRYYFAGRLESIGGVEEFVARLSTPRFGSETTFVEAPAFAPAPGTVRAVRETANTARIEVETAGRAFLVMSVTPHKYWHVTIDGVEAEPVVTNVGYQGVIVPAAGRHVVEMRYRNPLIAAGAAISVASLLALAYVAITMRAL